MLQFDNEVTVKTEEIVTIYPGVYYFLFADSDNDEQVYRKITVTDKQLKWITVRIDGSINALNYTEFDDYIPFQIERCFAPNQPKYKQITEAEFKIVFDTVLTEINALDN